MSGIRTRHRKLRRPWNEAGHAHELTFSCNGRLPLLANDRVRQWLLDAMDTARRRWDFELWAYVIMPEHVHMLVYPRRPHYEVAAFLKSVKQSVARKAISWLRQSSSGLLGKLRIVRAGRVEHRFWLEGGGYDRNIFDEATAWTCVEYIHRNPVRRGLVDAPSDWLWSSARWYEQLDGVKLEMDDCPPPVRNPITGCRPSR